MWLLSFLMPSVLTPFLSAALGFAGWFAKELWEGLKDIFDNLSTILTVATIASIATAYGYNLADCKISNPIPASKIWTNPLSGVFKPDG